jgi:hypothetical protein
MIEPKIDEVFEFNGKHYRCVEWKGCSGITSACDVCQLPDEACLSYACIDSSRDDNTDVIFREVEDEKES